MYHNTSNDPVGFGSLGVTEWKFGGNLVHLQYIPMLGVFFEHQGLPRPETASTKYCYQIIDHLLDEAEERKGEFPLVGLSVLPDNACAIHVYEKTGFVWAKCDGGYSRMFLAL